MEPEDETALTYLATQFPSDYDTKTEEQLAKQKPPTEAQKAAKEKAEIESYAQLVAEDAQQYQTQIQEK